jgi:hypothetical protein
VRRGTRGRAWLPRHSAELAALAAQGLTDAEIARRLGFTRQTVQQRRAALGLDNCYEVRPCGEDATENGRPEDG